MDKKAQKKKDREKRVRRQVLLRRAALRAPEEEENRLRRKMKRVAKIKKDMGDRNVWGDEVLMRLDDQTLTQLEKNAKILKALEEEYAQEKDKKSRLNQKLEEQGFLTLEEKLNCLHQQLVEEQKNLHDTETRTTTESLTEKFLDVTEAQVDSELEDEIYSRALSDANTESFFESQQ